MTKAISDTNLIISGATAASLALGRFVLMPIQRKFNAKAGLPTQNGVPHAEAGDRQACLSGSMAGSMTACGKTWVRT